MTVVNAAKNMTITPPIFPVPKEDLPFLKYVRTVGRNPLEIWSVRYYSEKVIVRRLPGQTDIVFNDPEAIRQVLNDQTNYQKSTITRRILLPQAGYGLFLAEGDRWKRQRHILSPAFTPRNIEKLLPHFVKAIGRWAAALDHSRPVNLSNEAQRLTLQIASQSFFSAAIDPGREEHIIDIFRDYTYCLGAPTFWDVIAKSDDGFAFATRQRRAFKRHWFSLIDQFLAERSVLPRRPLGRDVVDLLQEARDPETDEGLSHEEIIEEIATLTAAGFDTTSRSMFWTMYLLALAPEWQDVMRAEINDIPDLFEAPTLQKIDRLKKTKAVWQEAMRLYPPSSIITRQALKKNRILDTEIPKGALVIVAPWLLHRHHAFWEHPDQFMPQRFYDPSCIPKGVYIPFGIGPRVCLGSVFATMEAMLMITAVIKRWQVSLINSEPVLPVMLTATLPAYEPMFRLQPSRTTGAQA